MNRIVQMVVLIGASAWLSVAGASENREVLMYASDALGVPGAAVTLSVGVEEASDGVDRSRPAVGEPVEFLLYAIGGRSLGRPVPLGTAETDAHGRATLVWSPAAWSGAAEIGSFEVGARLERGGRIAGQARMEVLVPPADRALLLVKLDATPLSAPSAEATAGDPGEVSGATVLRELAEERQLVYLSEVEARAVPAFKAWMNRRGLPWGPILLLGDDAASLGPEERLTGRVRELVQAHPRIAIGIGATAADGRAFVTNGLAAIIVPADLDAVGEPPDGAFVTTSWTSAYAHLRLCEMSGELLRSLDHGGEEAREARRRLDRLGPAGAACVDRLREVPELRLAAIYVSDWLRGFDGFWTTVDVSTCEAVRDSLLAGWRFGEPSTTGLLYVDPREGETDPVAAYVRWESVGEPAGFGAASAVYTIRLIAEDGTSGTYEITCVQQPDSTWRIRAVDPVAGAS